MAEQGQFPILNGTGSTVLSEMNDNFAAAFSNCSGANPPSVKYGGQLWADETSNKLKIVGTDGATFYEIGNLNQVNLGLAPLSGPTFTGVLKIINGTAAAPSIQFTNDTDTGIFGTTGEVKIATAGNSQFIFSNTYFTSLVPLSVADGSATAPSITNTGDVNTGLYFPAADTLGVTTAGALQYSFDATSLQIKSQNEIRFNDDDNSHYVGVKAGTLTASQTFTLPTADGSDGQVLKTNGAGQLSFTTIGETAGVPTGSIFCMATTTVPSGYLECDGSDVSRSVFENLWLVLKDVGGTDQYFWGNGDGTYTFTLPDLRGEFIRGWDNSRGIDSGRSFGSVQDEAIKAHNHPFSFGNTYTALIPQSQGNKRFETDYEDATGFTTGTVTGSVGNSSGAETRPRNIAMMYVIKT